MDTSRKRLRAIAAVVVVAAHVALIYLAVILSGPPAASSSPEVQPVLATLLPRPPLPEPPKLPDFKPSPPDLSISLPEPQIEVPADPNPSPVLDPRSVAGPSGPHGPINSSGQSLTASLTRYVEPVYPGAAIRDGERGAIVVELRVDERGSVREVKVVKSSGYQRLDEAALHAVRQWRFARATKDSPAGDTSVVEKIQFGRVAAQVLQGVTLTMTPYDATIDQQISAALKGGHGGEPAGEGSLRGLIGRLLGAFPDASRTDPGGAQHAPDSMEELFVTQGPVQSIQFLGFATNGLERDRVAPGLLRTLTAPLRLLSLTHWEAYEVKQSHGSSVWLLAVTPHGSIERAQAAVRVTGPMPGFQ